MPIRKTTVRDRARADLPYGLWRLENGREILFNRYYQPIWERSPFFPPRPANRTEWVFGARTAQVTYLYTDATTPYQNPETRRRCEETLQLFQNGEKIPTG